MREKLFCHFTDRSLDMNSTAREQIIAAKEKLHRRAEEAREEERRKASQAYWEKTQAEERAQEEARLVYHQNQVKYLAEKEKSRVEDEAKKEEEHLRNHNRTVKQVLSRVAKAGRQDRDGDEEGDDEDSDKEDSSEESEDGIQPEGGDRQQSKLELNREPLTAEGLGKQSSGEKERHREKRKSLNRINLFFISFSQTCRPAHEMAARSA